MPANAVLPRVAPQMMQLLVGALLLVTCQFATAQNCSDTCAAQARDGTAQAANNGVCEEPHLGAPCEAEHACACPEHSDATDCEALRPCSRPPPTTTVPSPTPQSVHGDSVSGVGGARTNAADMPSIGGPRLSVTATPYEDLQCNDRAMCDHLIPRSETDSPAWLEGRVAIQRDLATAALGTECAVDVRTDASLAPAATAELISGECTSCSAVREAQVAVGSGQWWPCFPESDMEFMVEVGVNPDFVKITCEGENYRVEHFSDAECSVAVSNDDISAAMMAGAEFEVYLMFLPLALFGMSDVANDLTSGIMGCFKEDFNHWSGVSFSHAHCEAIYDLTMDEVRLCFARHTQRICTRVVARVL